MEQLVNRQVRLASRPEGLPKREDWQFTEEQVAEPGEGEILIKVLYASLDPAMRGWMNDAKSYIPPVGIGEVMRAGTVGEVLASKNDKFKAGDHVYGTQGIQQYAISDGKGLMKVDPKLSSLTTYLGTLGMPGFTAYFGLLDVGMPKEGDVVLVSGGAGAVGHVVGQIAKIKGCRVVGIAGGEEKCQYLKDLGFDEAIDYKTGDLYKSVKAACPDGVDVYFDNVGGPTLDVALSRLRRGARVVICGAISQYNNTDGVTGPANYLQLLVQRARMEGFVVFDYAKRYPEALRDMAGWMAAGKLKTREHIDEGLDTFPEVLLKLFSGQKMGKLVLKLHD